MIRPDLIEQVIRPVVPAQFTDDDYDVFINPTGNPGMATGGSGDALTGMTGAFLARGLDPLAAVTAACYLHGLAGDFAAAEWGEEGMIAGDIVEAIAAAMKSPEVAPRQ